MQIPVTPTLFWDCDMKDIDVKKHARFIIERILSRGEVEDFSWAKKTYGDANLKEVVIQNPTLDKRSQNFWCSYFHIRPTVCTRNPSNKKHWQLWAR